MSQKTLFRRIRDLRRNILTLTDSYKSSMWKQYPPNTEFVYSYIESRGGVHDEVTFFGLQAFIKEFLLKPITQEEVDTAALVWAAHGVQFPKAQWDHIVQNHGGKLPLRIRAVKEGTTVPVKNVLCVVENTDPLCYWLTTWVETGLLRAIWYATTVCTNSRQIKKLLKQYLEKSGTPEDIYYKLHDFGARGASSAETAEIGGTAHLVNFRGTDTFSALIYAAEFYNAIKIVDEKIVEVPGHSINAAEHSTITSWERHREIEAYRNMVRQFGGNGNVLAVVSDSYDIYNACKIWGTDLKEEVINSGATVVIRPDSGDPLEVIPRMCAILGSTFGFGINNKGYKVLNHVRIIWGDGIDPVSLASILRTMVDFHGWSADNFAFGMGGGLLQKVDRDSQKFAMKCSAIGVSSVTTGALTWRQVFKDPITDKGKASKKGRVTLFKDKVTGRIYSGVEDWMQDMLVDFYKDGELLIDQQFNEIRDLSEVGL